MLWGLFGPDLSAELEAVRGELRLARSGADRKAARCTVLERDLADAERRASGLAEVLHLISVDVCGKAVGWGELREAIRGLVRQGKAVSSAAEGRATAERQFRDKCAELDALKATVRSLSHAASLTDENGHPVEDGDRPGLVEAVRQLRRRCDDRGRELLDLRAEAAADGDTIAALRDKVAGLTDRVASLVADAEAGASLAQEADRARHAAALSHAALVHAVREVLDRHASPSACPGVSWVDPLNSLSVDTLWTPSCFAGESGGGGGSPAVAGVAVVEGSP